MRSSGPPFPHLVSPVGVRRTRFASSGSQTVMSPLPEVNDCACVQVLPDSFALMAPVSVRALA